MPKNYTKFKILYIMKTIFETVHKDGDFFVDILNTKEQTLAFKSLEKDINDLNYFFFILSKEEALSLAGHILKLYSE